MDVSESQQETTGLRARLGEVGLRTRLLAAFLAVAVITVGLGAFGVQRMSTLRDQAREVYSDGAVPLDGLRGLQADWWELSTYTARAAIAALPPASIAQAQQDAGSMAQKLTADQATVADMTLPADARAAFEQFSQAVSTYLGALQQLQSGSAGADTPALLKTMDDNETVIASSIATATDAAVAAAQATVQESEDAYSSARTLTLLAVALGVIASIALALLIVRVVTGPVQRVKTVLDRVAEGDLSVRVGRTGGAEIGEVARSLDRTLDALGSVLSLVSDSAGRLSGASQKLTAGADAIADNARVAAGQADVVVASAGEVASSVDTVATGSQQMESAIREIAHNATEASRVASQAVGVAEETTRMVGKLGDSSQEIAAVVKLINGIAEQTNLLALNATIEAARAGEAGKGFAVVASEVKELAQETARATEDISQRVAAIQADTAGAVQAIGQISSVIGEINDFQSTIAAAVEEQTATTNEMNRNVAEAAGSSRSIATAITGLAAGTQATNDRVADAQQSAAELAGMSAELQAAVSRFTV